MFKNLWVILGSLALTFASFVHASDSDLKIAEEKCALGDYDQCANAAFMYGNLGEDQKSFNLYYKACENNSGAGCFGLAMAFVEDPNHIPVVTASNKRAYEYLKKGCDLNDGMACYWLADFYEKGIVVQPSFSMASKLYKKACDLGTETDDPCTRPQEQDFKNAIAQEQLRNSQEQLRNSKVQSADLGKLIEEAKKVLDQCLENEGMSFFVMGSFLQENKKNALLAFTELRKQYEKGCASNNAKDCLYRGFLSDIDEGEQSLSEAAKYYQKGCDLNDRISCRKIGSFYDQGKGVSQSLPEARKFWQKGCQLNDPKSCTLIGILYEMGMGVRQSNKQAKEYYGKACDLGYEGGCQDYARLNQGEK